MKSFWFLVCFCFSMKRLIFACWLSSKVFDSNESYQKSLKGKKINFTFIAFLFLSFSSFFWRWIGLSTFWICEEKKAYEQFMCERWYWVRYTEMELISFFFHITLFFSSTTIKFINQNIFWPVLLMIIIVGMFEHLIARFPYEISTRWLWDISLSDTPNHCKPQSYWLTSLHHQRVLLVVIGTLWDKILA